VRVDFVFAFDCLGLGGGSIGLPMIVARASVRNGAGFDRPCV